jgi:glycosyltransferase involved in cell wall biosynthesis
MVDEAVGVLAPRATASSLAEAVEALFRCDVAALGAAGRRRVEALYGWDAVFTALTGVYETLVAGEDDAGPVAEVVPLAPWMHAAS